MSDVKQISLSLSVERDAIVPAAAASKARQEREAQAIRERCVTEFGEAPGFDLHMRLAPFIYACPLVLKHTFEMYISCSIVPW
jgi:hypothetical protein